MSRKQEKKVQAHVPGPSVTKLDISTDLFTSNLAYGIDSSADDFGLVGWIDRHRIQKLCLTLGSTAVLRIRFDKDDGTCLVIGGKVSDPNPRQVEWTFDTSERFRTITVYTDPKSQILSGLRMVTAMKTVEAHIDESTKGQSVAHDIPVGSGECVGIFGNAHHSVVSVGFAMLRSSSESGSLGEESSGLEGSHGGRSGGRRG